MSDRMSEWMPKRMSECMAWQKECQDYMPDRIPKRMSDNVRIHYIQKVCQKECQIECQKECQIECHSILVPYIPPDDMSETFRNYVRIGMNSVSGVGITRSQVI